MNSRKKIWSIPISLALVLVLVASVGLYSIVQAQTATNVVAHMKTDDSGIIATVTVSGLTVGETDTDASNDAIVAASAVLTGTNNTLFAPTIGTVVQTGDDAGTQPITIAPAAGNTAAGVYNLTLTAKVDRDIDDNDGTNTGSGSAVDNDEDATVTASVTIYVVGGPTTATQFHGDPNTALAGQRASTFGMDVRNAPQSIKITGMSPNAKILVDDDGTAGADADSGVLSSQNGLEFSVDPSDRTRVIAKFSGATLSDDSTSTIAVDIDTDATKDAPDDEDAGTTWDDDGIADNDIDLDDVSFSAALATVASLEWNDADDDTLGDIAPSFAFTMLSNEPSGSAIGNVYVDGADLDTNADDTTTTDDGEFLDGILLDSDGNAQTMFTVRGANATVADNQALQLIYNGGTLSLGTHSFRLSVNGDSGIAHRTISDGGDDADDPLTNVTVTVNPVNEGPMGPDSHSARVTETVEGDGILADGDEVADLSGLATDTNTLIYDLSGEDAGLFEVDSGTGVVTVDNADGIAANVVATPAVVDNPVTTDVNEAKAAVYGRPPVPSGDGGELVDTSSIYSDITYEFTVNVSDGNAASSHNIAVTLTVDVNEPVTEMGDIGGDAPSYKTTDVQNHEIVDLNDYLSGSDSPDDDVTYVWEITPVNPPFGIYDGSIRVNYPGPSRPIVDDPLTTDVDESWDPEEDGWTIRIYVGDAFVNGAGPEVCEDPDDPTGDDIACDIDGLDNGVDAVLDLTIKQIPGPPLQSFDLVFEVDENAAAGTSVGTLDVEGATTYSVISGTGGARDDFAVDPSTGEITVVNGRDYDAADAENNIVLLVDAFGENGIRLGAVIAGIAIQNIDEDPVITDLVTATDADGDFDGLNSEIPWVYETAQIGDAVVTKPVGQAGAGADDLDTIIEATDPEGAAITFSISSTGSVPFAIDSSSGALTVSGALDKEVAGSHTFTVMAADPAGNNDTMEVTVHVLNSNETPVFTSPTGDAAVTTIPENTPNAHVIFTFTATDEDGDDLEFTLREGQSRDLFVIESAGSAMVNGDEVWSGELHVKTDVTLDYEDAGYDPRVHVEANDPEGLNATLLLTVNLSNVNDNDPAFDATPALTLSVAENTARDYVLSNYSASDADGDVDGDGVVVSYSLRGEDAKSFSISDTGDLQTLESLDADNAMTPCGSDGCSVMVVASDGERETTASVRITVTGVEDSVSTLGVSKANPVPGTTMGNAMSALSNTKTEANAAVPERPADLPATYGDAPMNFVATEWGNWGTVLRIAVTSESPDPNCGNGNQCVIVDINSDSADDALKLQAYRSADQENKFVAAVMLVETTDEATPGDDAVYTHNGGGVPAIRVDEEDEIEVEFGNLRDSIDVENEAPEIGNFAPEHDTAFDDADVDYTFTVTDAHSGLPEPEDLPDVDGDDNYTPVVALISRSQCETVADGTDKRR